MAGYLYFSNN